jgi:tetratricopeptide (TPR) repeat protein
MNASFVFLLILSVVVGGFLWFIADMSFAQKWQLKRAALGAQDKSRELDGHFQSRLKCRRPMLLLFQRFVVPGLIEADYALHVSKQGEHERALRLAQKASRKAARRVTTHLAVLPAEAMILSWLGRYEEARQVVQLGRNLLASRSTELAKDPGRSNLTGNIILQDAMIEMYLGHLDAALKLGIEAGAATVSDPARTVISAVLTAMGRFKEALDALAYEPSRFYKFLNPSAMDLLENDKLFQETARQIDEQISGVFGPAAELGKASIYLEAGDAEKLGLALDQVQKKLKSHRVMEHIYVRTRACWHAMKGDVAGVEADLARVRDLAAENPASRSAKYETHLASGRAFLLLGQSERAIGEFKSANQLALHPLEKHVSTYWLARGNEGMDNTTATIQFRTVIADGFGTWMEADAQARVR